MGKSIAEKKAAFQQRGSTPLAVFYCPSRRTPLPLPNVYNDCNSNAVTQASRSDYAANCGVNQNIWWNYVSTSGDPSFTKANNYQFPSFNGDGVIFTLSTISSSKVADGLSTTYLLGEKYLNIDRDTDSKEATDNNPAYCGFDWDFQRWAGSGLRRDRKGLSDYYSFGSAHIGGANMTFCDGSVKFVNFNVDTTTHSRLCNRQDGKPVDASKL